MGLRKHPRRIPDERAEESFQTAAPVVVCREEPENVPRSVKVRWFLDKQDELQRQRDMGFILRKGTPVAISRASRGAVVRFMEWRLLRFCQRRFDDHLGVEHGPSHWRRVAAFGDILCDRNPEVDRMVVRAFACLHDVEREDNYDDLEHGPRAAELVRRIRWTHLRYLDDTQVGLLSEACRVHTTAARTGNPTVDACLDADRLDLCRCGIIPDPERMASREGAELAAHEDYINAVWKAVNAADA